MKKLKSQQIARHYFCFERAICGAVRRKEKPNDIILANKNYYISTTAASSTTRVRVTSIDE